MYIRKNINEVEVTGPTISILKSLVLLTKNQAAHIDSAQTPNPIPHIAP
jgi:hypothetical protein